MTMDGVFSTSTVAVITGAAQGIGRATCLHAATQGSAICVVDLPGDKLDQTVGEISDLSPRGAEAVLAAPADVSDPDQVAAVKEAVLDRFSKVTFLMNNAVTRAGRGFDAGIKDWHEAMDVNFWGCVYFLKAFLPAMQAGEEKGIIVNVGSKQGITNPPGHPIYNITKSALKTYTEALQHDFRSQPDNRVDAHLLIPGWTSEDEEAVRKGAWRPSQVVDFMLKGLEQDHFYILCPDNEVTTEMDHKRIAWGAGDIIENRPPLSRWHPDWQEIAKKNCS